MLDKIENILNNGEVWAIDLLPERCDDVRLFNEFEEILCKKSVKRTYIQRILSIFVKIAVYYDSSMWIGDTRIISLKRYSNNAIGKNVKLSKKITIIRKILWKDESISILLEPINAVLSLGLYNSAIILTNDTDKEILNQIVGSEGLFIWENLDRRI